MDMELFVCSTTFLRSNEIVGFIFMMADYYPKKSKFRKKSYSNADFLARSERKKSAHEYEQKLKTCQDKKEANRLMWEFRRRQEQEKIEREMLFRMSKDARKWFMAQKMSKKLVPFGQWKKFNW